MKALKTIPLILILLVSSSVFVACKKDKKTIKAVEKNIVKGNWRVSKFIDSGTDETNDFTGYNFTFTEGGSVTASNGSLSYTGTWSITASSSDDSNDDVDFNLMFSVSEENDFEDLNDDWDILSQSETKIELTDVSGGNGGTDYLTFEKN